MLAPNSALANVETAFTLTLHKESDGNDMDFDVIASDGGVLASIHIYVCRCLTDKTIRTFHASCQS
jgi:hypothetical protein